VGEKAVYADPVAAAGEKLLPKYGIEVIGVWRPSSLATDLTAELTAIKGKGAHIIWEINNAPMGYALAKGVSDLKVPVAVFGAEGRAQEKLWWKTTEGKGNYTATMIQHCAAIAFTPKSQPFFREYEKRFDDYPGVAGFVYDCGLILQDAIERAGTLDFDAVVAALEKTDFEGAQGRIAFETSHELKWGPGWTTGGVVQWVDGKLNPVWPAPWPGCPEEWKNVKYEGVKSYVIPPLVLEYWKGKK